MKFVVDLNCDMGESFGQYTVGFDEEMIKHISSANIGCGYHGGDPTTMEKTVELCKQFKVGVGAHPSFPDLMGFGRRNMDIHPRDLSNYVLYQIGALAAFAKSNGLPMQHVKLHGALYNLAARDGNIARVIAKTIKNYDDSLIFLVLANSEMENAAVSEKMRYACEIFADRNYASDGTLVNRNHPEAFVKDPFFAAQRMVQIIKSGEIEAIDGSRFKVSVHSLCLHGDNPQAVEMGKTIRAALENENIQIKPMSKIV